MMNIILLLILIGTVIGQQTSIYGANCNIILSSNSSEVTESASLLIDPCEVALFSYRNFSIDGVLEISLNGERDPYLCNCNSTHNVYDNLYNTVLNAIANATNSVIITDYSSISTSINNVYSAIYNLVNEYFQNRNSKKIVLVERGIIIIIMFISLLVIILIA